MKAKLIKLENGEYDLLVDTNVKNLAGTKLSIKNCLAIEKGYDLDELAIQKYPIENTGNMYMPNRNEVSSIFRQEGFKAGFQKALELMGDKKFSKEDMIYFGGFCVNKIDAFNDVDDLFKKYQPLQKTEWDVEVEMEGFVDEEGIYCGERPKLDADGCLILKKM